MKRIAICCDGTWNRLAAPQPTNVVRLAEAVLPTANDKIPQVTFYDEGVGSGSTPLFNRTVRLASGMFGWGLMARLEAAYRFLVFNYEPGDEIYIFGFSRGAFTARSLAGLIRNCSIVNQSNAHGAHEAIWRYRSRAKADEPDSPDTSEFRARLAPHLFLNEVELAWRRANIPDFDESKVHRLTIRYLGVWDTVGSLGLPNHFRLARFFNRRYRFHDHKLSSSVLAARHAVAIDEIRRAFEPTLWDNLPTLNRERGRAGQPLPYQEAWFPGDHSSVGGGGIVRGLAAAALCWVIEGAETAGLGFHQGLLTEYREAIDHAASLMSSGRPPRWYYSKAPREGPTRIEDLAGITLRRWREVVPAYRPSALSRLAAEIDRAGPPVQS